MRFSDIPVFPVLVMSGLSGLLIALGNWVRRIDDSLADFDDLGDPKQE